MGFKNFSLFPKKLTSSFERFHENTVASLRNLNPFGERVTAQKVTEQVRTQDVGAKIQEFMKAERHVTNADLIARFKSDCTSEYVRLQECEQKFLKATDKAEKGMIAKEWNEANDRVLHFRKELDALGVDFNPAMC